MHHNVSLLCLSVAFLGPSVTPYSDMNPGYRVYHIDGTRPNSTRAGLYHETFYLNLTDANLTNKPKWLFEYSTKVLICCAAYIIG